MGNCLYRTMVPRNIFQIKAGKGRTCQSSASHGKTLYRTSERTNLRKTVYPKFKTGKEKTRPAACTGGGAPSGRAQTCSRAHETMQLSQVPDIIRPMSPMRWPRHSEVLSPCPVQANVVSLPPYEDLWQ